MRDQQRFVYQPTNLPAGTTPAPYAGSALAARVQSNECVEAECMQRVEGEMATIGILLLVVLVLCLLGDDRPQGIRA